MPEIDPDDPFERLLVFLRDTRSFDFTGYKRTTLRRRVDKRMQAIGVGDYEAYHELLEVDEREFTELFNFILINVTGFFRDPAVWEYLDRAVLSEIVERPQRPIRVWSVGCAGGQEAYTVAMLLAERLGAEGLQEAVKIYATDVDEEALVYARQAQYSRKEVEGVPDAFLERYFDAAGDTFTFKRDLRRALIFGRHDLVQDAPISRVDLLLCRNTLMYFNADTQVRVMERLAFSLNSKGFLVLGKSEMPLTKLRSFVPLDLKNRIFVKASADGAEPADAGKEGRHMDGIDAVQAALEENPFPQLVVDDGGRVVAVSRRARELLGVQRDAVGLSFHDLDISYRPVDLRSAIDQAYATRRQVDLPRVVTGDVGGGRHTFDVVVAPLIGGERLLGASISFIDVSRHEELRTELESANQELQTAMEELQSTNEELETTNEELQSTNEELETTNEELQSTNEELETMNEELVSTNEELETMNEELSRRTGQLAEVNAFMDGILGSVRAGVVVVDADLRVEVWNRIAEDLWGLRADEVLGQPLLNLDIGLPLQEVRDLIRETLASAGPHVRTVDATNRRGRSIRCRLTCSGVPVKDREGGAVLLMEDEDDRQGFGNSDAG
jgi:two-component system CheB/CheR fusion protein